MSSFSLVKNKSAAAVPQPSTQEGDVKVPNPPADCISSLAFNGNLQTPSTLLAATAWDGTVSVYEIQYSQQGVITNVVPRQQLRHQAPALCCDFNSIDNVTVFSGGCDNKVNMFNASQPGATMTTVGQHDGPVKCIKFLPEKQLLLTGSWDRTVKLWDLRSPQPVATLPQSERVYCMDARGQVLVVGLAGRKFAIYDLNSGQKVQEIDSPLQYQTRCCAVFHDCAGFAIGGIEGRVALEYFDEMHLRGKQLPPGSPKPKSFAFKCHREKADIFPINAVGFHPRNTFVTAGADGCIYTWDKDVRHKLGSLELLKFQVPIADAKFAPMGNVLAYAASYEWSRGAENYDASKGHQIYLHHLQPAEYERKDPSTLKK